jgi:hypothetical protein
MIKLKFLGFAAKMFFRLICFITGSLLCYAFYDLYPRIMYAIFPHFPTLLDDVGFMALCRALIFPFTALPLFFLLNLGIFSSKFSAYLRKLITRIISFAMIAFLLYEAFVFRFYNYLDYIETILSSF